jgi:organic hydroperoxide reductase OsmC/OhrA
MEIRATVQNRGGEHSVTLSTDGCRSSLSVPAKTEGAGSSVNGGELLCLALATCYCNDLYREAARLGMRLSGVEVEVTAEFGGLGEPARRITYAARVSSDAPAAEVEELLRHTDRVAEIQNTLRAGVAVELRGGLAQVGLEAEGEGPKQVVSSRTRESAGTNSN